MIPKEIEKAFNKQINEELYSAYLYMQMSAYFEGQNLSGFAQWLKIQAQEEVSHAMKFYSHIFERAGKVELQAISKPPVSWNSPLDAFKAAYAHEQHITGCISSLVEKSAKAKDHAGVQMLQWFVAEQVEEEASADEVVQKLKMVGDSKVALYMLDKEMGSRKSG